MRQNVSFYSRNGCLQCKKAHTKCDEKKPACTRCGRKNVSCTYKMNFISAPFNNTTTNNNNNTSSGPSKKRKLKLLKKDATPDPANDVLFDSKNTANLKNAGDGNLWSYSFLGEYEHYASNLSSMMFFPQTHLQIMNILNLDESTKPNLIYSHLDSRVDSSNRDNSWESLTALIKSLDPINISKEKKKELTYVPIEDPEFLDFIWFVCKKTFCVGQFALFTDEKFSRLLVMLKTLDSAYPIIHCVIRYAVATYMKDLYHRTGEESLSAIWDTLVRIPSIKPCLDLMNNRIINCNDYIESNALAFSVALLFSPHTRGLNSNWRSHLRGLYLLLKKSLDCFEENLLETEMGRIAFSLFGVTNALFCRTEVCACIAADNGGVLTTINALNIVYHVNPFPTFHLLSNEYDLAIGCTSKIYPACRRISTELIKYRQKKINLSGSNFIKFKFTNKDKLINKELHEFGLKILKEINQFTDESNLDSKKILPSVQDYKLRYTIDKCNKLDILSLKIYLRTFFLKKNSENDELINERLEQVLEIWYGIPYATSVINKCHWAIYYSALTAIMLGKNNLIVHFSAILDEMARKGLDMAANSAKRLKHIFKMLQIKDYDALIDDSNNDFIVY